MTRRRLIPALLLLLTPAIAWADHLPDPNLTPGAVRPGVTTTEVCRPGYTAATPPIAREAEAQVLAAYGLADTHSGYCEAPHGCVIDHLIAAALGGSDQPANLWPAPNDGEWNVHFKRKLEEELHRLVCRGELPMRDAQEAIANDWVAAYRQYVGEPPDQP